MSKAAKHRACPAVGREISSAECGANRISRYACPASCAYLPFAPANYTQLLDLETKVDGMTMDFLQKHEPNHAIIERAAQRLSYSKNPHALHAFYEWTLFFARGADGLTCMERWEKSAGGSLKNDELVLLRAKRQKRVALLEIRRVVDAERIDAVDLLAPELGVLRIHDRSLASMAVRFASGLLWAYPLPHYWRLSGTAVLIPELAQFEPREIVTEIVSHLKGPTTVPEMRLWLAENFVLFDEALMAVSRQRRMQMFAGLDAKMGKAVYELQAAFGECRSLLDEVIAVEADRLSAAEEDEGFAEARVWFAEAGELGAATPSRGRAALGRVLLGQAHWRLEAFGGERLGQLRQQFEKQMGKRARFTGERMDDLAAGLMAKEPAFDKKLVPPRLLENPQHFEIGSSVVPMPASGGSPEQIEAEIFEADDRRFLDDKVPALDGHTPREAAKDPVLRPRLIRLLKQRVRQTDERNLETGGNHDANWLLRELGANEIIFEPPPWRPPTERIVRDDSGMEGVFDDGFEDELLTPLADLPLAPRVTGPLSVEEAYRRMDAALAKFAEAEDAAESLADCGITIADEAYEILLDCITEEEFDVAMVFILQAVYALVPPGHRAPPTDIDSLEKRFVANLKGLEKSVAADKPDVFQDFLESGAQPNVTIILAAQIAQRGLSKPEMPGLNLDTQPVIIAMVKSVLEELDEVLRSGDGIVEI